MTAVETTQTTCQLRVTGMDCGDCAKTVEQSLRTLPGVAETTVNFVRGTADVTYDPAGKGGDNIHLTQGDLGLTHRRRGRIHRRLIGQHLGLGAETLGGEVGGSLHLKVASPEFGAGLIQTGLTGVHRQAAKQGPGPDIDPLQDRCGGDHARRLRTHDDRARRLGAAPERDVIGVFRLRGQRHAHQGGGGGGFGGVRARLAGMPQERPRQQVDKHHQDDGADHDIGGLQPHELWFFQRPGQACPTGSVSCRRLVRRTPFGRK